MADDTVKLNLKEVLLDFEGKKMHDTSRLDRPVSELEGKTQKEVYEMAPELTFGFLIASMLAGAVKAKDPAEAAKLFRLSSKVHNKEMREDGIWTIDENEVKDLKDLLKKVDGHLAQVKFMAPVWIKLEDCETDLKDKREGKAASGK